ncbi:MAG TPA: peptidase inhibitor family I36 protein [Rugosimonospora sp.]|nr:peptidase inhibitor family I36 protein [Rugosimonospora sp.]
MAIPRLRAWPAVSMAVLSVVAALAVAAPASAASSATQRQVDAYLAGHPGGQQINSREISYSNGTFIVTVVPAVATSAPDCPPGWFCFYAHTNFGYPRGKLSDCGWQDLSTWGWQNRTESVHYNLSTGSVAFIGESGSTDSVLFTVDTGRRAIADVSPYRNQADFVYRYC